MRGDRLHVLNIFLMALSAISAIRFPIETLLLAYGILGPLHYLTEISWLRDRNYFLPSRNDVIPILYAGLALVFGSAFLSRDNYARYFPTIYALTLLTIFGFTFILPLFRSWQRRVMAALIFAVLSWEMQQNLPLTTSVVAFLPTIVHVYLFTGLFILSGCIKSPTKIGISALLIFCALPITCWLAPVDWTALAAPWATSAYNETLGALNILILSDFGLHIPVTDVTSDRYSILVTRILAFAYVYHYLNWFSKTSVIGWTNMSMKRAILIGICWVGSVVLYAYNFVFGFQLLLALSFLHVLLEFPLNHITIRQLFSAALNKALTA
jgi:hypothetical protein